MIAVQFSVPGVPVGKGRAKFARRGKFTIAYTPEKTVNYENLVKFAASKAMDGKIPIVDAVSVTIIITVNPPESWSQKKRLLALSGYIHPTTKPDIDNVIKTIFDAMNAIVWIDDKQVVHNETTKLYGEIASASVAVSLIPNPDDVQETNYEFGGRSIPLLEQRPLVDLFT